MGWGSRTSQEKADSFDAQYEHSKAQSEAKKARGEHPYELDAAVKSAGKVKPAEKRGKGKHAK